jgi:hypothetical protein
VLGLQPEWWGMDRVVPVWYIFSNACFVNNARSGHLHGSQLTILTYLHLKIMHCKMS